jgi:hypothetical protein
MMRTLLVEVRPSICHESQYKHGTEQRDTNIGQQLIDDTRHAFTVFCLTPFTDEVKLIEDDDV